MNAPGPALAGPFATPVLQKCGLAVARLYHVKDNYREIPTQKELRIRDAEGNGDTKEMDNLKTQIRKDEITNCRTPLDKREKRESGTIHIQAIQAVCYNKAVWQQRDYDKEIREGRPGNSQTPRETKKR